jgi:hypothetical protein
MITITEASGTVGILNLLGHGGYWYGREKKAYVICPFLFLNVWYVSTAGS